MTPQEKKDLDMVVDIDSDVECQECGTCVGRCLFGLDIPALMRSYESAFWYRDLAAAKESFESATVDGVPCGACPRCTVDCMVGFSAKQRIEAVAEFLQGRLDT